MSPVKLLPCLLLTGMACTPSADLAQTTGSARWFEGARLVVGDGTAPIETAVFQVENGRFTLVGKSGEVEVPAGEVRVDLTGKTVMPAIIDLHTHPGASPARGLAAAEDARADLIDQLSRAAYHGVGTLVSLGGGGDLHRQVRDEGPHSNGARFLVAGRRLDGRPAAVRNSPELTEFFWIQARNLQKVNRAGVRIALGTDGRRFTIGWSAHTQMEDMVLSGMTPAEVIVAATRTPAEILGLNDLGTVAQGKIADFLVLDANPLEAITNTRSIAQVYLRGNEVDRQALRAQWTGDGTPH